MHGDHIRGAFSAYGRPNPLCVVSAVQVMQTTACHAPLIHIVWQLQLKAKLVALCNSSLLLLTVLEGRVRTVRTRIFLCVHIREEFVCPGAQAGEVLLSERLLEHKVSHGTFSFFPIDATAVPVTLVVNTASHMVLQALLSGGG